MNDDYLWDRSGEPDPEIQQLEEILGELRYQPRPLEIPADQKTGGHGFRFSRYAIAAAVALMVLGLGVWLAIQKQNQNVAVKSNDAEVKTPAPQNSPETPHTVSVGPVDHEKQKNRTTPAETVTTPRPVRVRSHRPRRIRTPQFTSVELAEAVAAKNQLMMALRLTSSKLNYAQKKTQGSNPATPVFHQHKIG